MNDIYYYRAIENQVLQLPQKIKLILGARQTGKTTLLKYLLEKQSASIAQKTSEKIWNDAMISLINI